MRMSSSEFFQRVPGNEPLARPGIYSVRHVESGRIYIGMSQNVARRIREHENGCGGGAKLQAAITLDGPAAFVAEPLCYALKTHDHLADIEAEMISAFGAVESGYNTAARGRGAGPYGPAFSAALRAAKAMPEARAKMTASFQNPEHRQRRADAIRLGLANPEVRARRSQTAKERGLGDQLADPRIKEIRMLAEAKPEVKANRSRAMARFYADPGSRAHHLQRVREANACPERARKIAESRMGRKWITDGTSDRCIQSGEQIPEGWRQGRSKGPGAKPSV